MLRRARRRVRRTFERRTLGTADQDIKVAQVVVVRDRGDTRRRVGYQSLGLLQARERQNRDVSGVTQLEVRAEGLSRATRGELERSHPTQCCCCPSAGLAESQLCFREVGPRVEALDSSSVAARSLAVCLGPAQSHPTHLDDPLGESCHRSSTRGYLSVARKVEREWYKSRPIGREADEGVLNQSTAAKRMKSAGSEEWSGITGTGLVQLLPHRPCRSALTMAQQPPRLPVELILEIFRHYAVSLEQPTPVAWRSNPSPSFERTLKVRQAAAGSVERSKAYQKRCTGPDTDPKPRWTGS